MASHVDGRSEEYYENGQLKTKGSYTGGKRDGMWEEYYENGQLKTKRSYNASTGDTGLY